LLKASEGIVKDLKNHRCRFDEVEIDVQNLRVRVGSGIRPRNPAEGPIRLRSLQVALYAEPEERVLNEPAMRNGSRYFLSCQCPAFAIALPGTPPS
jgi:hypothetical protein